jgi:hypothetical protein
MEFNKVNSQFAGAIDEHALIYKKGDIPTEEQKKDLKNLIYRLEILEIKLWDHLNGKDEDHIIV